LKPVIVTTPRLAAPFVERLEKHYTVVGPIAGLEPGALPPEAREAKALITLGSYGTPNALMAALPSLGLILCYGTGFEGVDLEAARRRGVAVTNAGDTNAETVAEFAMGLTLATGRKIVEGDRYVRDGRWKGNAIERMPLVPGLLGKRMGIYGLGAIGRRVATRAAAFGMQIGYHNRRQVPDLDYEYHHSLQSLAGWCDVLMVSVRAAAENRHSVNARVLAALGPEGHVVNISRGSVVDTEALCGALERQAIAGAALDVYEQEPHVPERLRAIPTAVLTPHIGAYAESAQVVQQQVVLDNLEALLAGRPLTNQVT
jgi:lactate dehydrogenase-like 2-hydroxyacid dehydrogenase